ncbi:hypothetical protein Tco_0509150 [Tanacetum coccineum]
MDSIRRHEFSIKTIVLFNLSFNQKSVENADLKAQIQEKVFANAALKNELRKLKGNSVDTKFAKPSILGKPVLQPHRNQSVVRQQYVLAKPHHVIAPGSDWYVKKTVMVQMFGLYNHYREEVRWIPTGKMFPDNIIKVDSEPPNGSNDSSLIDYMSLFTSVQALHLHRHIMKSVKSDIKFMPVLKEEEGVRFSALYLQKKRNLLVFDHSYQHDSCFFYARSVIKWINYFNPSPSVVQHVLVAVVQEPVISTGIPSSMRIDQDTHLRTSQNHSKMNILHVILTSVEDEDLWLERLDEMGGVLKNETNQGAKENGVLSFYFVGYKDGMVRLIVDIEDKYHGPCDTLQQPSLPLKHP